MGSDRRCGGGFETIERGNRREESCVKSVQRGRKGNGMKSMLGLSKMPLSLTSWRSMGWRMATCVTPVEFLRNVASSSSSSSGLPSPSVPQFAEEAPYSYIPPGRNHLFVPGPCNLPHRVQVAMAHPAENHRDVGFPYFAKQLFKDLAYLFKTENGRVFLFPGTGTGGWESCLSNTLSPGDKVVCFRYGVFSHLWVDMAQRLGLDVIVLDEEWGNGADEARLQKVLEEDVNKEIKAVMVVQNETTTGVTSDLAKCRQAIDAAKHQAMFFVDGVSGIGATDMKFDDWGIDVAVTGSQKALSLPTGLGLVCASQKALAARHSAKMNRVYFNWEDHLKVNDAGGFPYTPCSQLMRGLRVAIDMLMEEGLDYAFARHARLAEGTRQAVRAWGHAGVEILATDPRWYSNSLTVIKVPEGVDSTALVNTAYNKYNLSLGLGLAKVAGKVFRIGHLGDMNEVSMLGAIAGTEMAMRDVGINVQMGSGVGAAAAYWQETSAVIPSRVQQAM